MNKIKHSKIKNTGLIFEILSRQITSDILENNKNSLALNILQKYFSGGTELNKELILYNILSENKSIDTENKANNLIDLVLEKRKTLNEKKLNKEKYNLISEIKDNYDLESIFNSRIYTYKTLAGIYKLFKSIVEQNENYNPTDIVQSKYCIIENLIIPRILKNNNEQTVEEAFENYKKQDFEIKLLTYKILLERFNQKYGKLNKYQKRLLKEYINDISNNNTLRGYLESEIIIIKEILSEFISNTRNKVLKIKLQEVHNQLNNITNGKVIKDEKVIIMLKLYELINELKKKHNIDD